MTRITGRKMLLVAAVSLVTGTVHAQASPAWGPVETVQAFHQKLELGDATGAVALMADDVTIFEQGYASAGKQSYLQNQAQQDVGFAHDTRYKVLKRVNTWLGENAAMVVTQLQTTGTFASQSVDSVGTETMVLRRQGGVWRIIHVHWSAHPNTGGG